MLHTYIYDAVQHTQLTDTTHMRRSAQPKALVETSLSWRRLHIATRASFTRYASVYQQQSMM